MKNPTTEHVRSLYGAVVYPEAEPAERRRALLRLHVLATRLRKSGVAEEHNAAVALLRSAGVLPARPPYRIPDRLLTDLQAARVTERQLRALRALLAFRTKALEEYTPQDIEDFVRRPKERTRLPDAVAWDPGAVEQAETGFKKGRDNERCLLRCVFRAYFRRRGITQPNPVPDRRPARRAGPETYPAAVRDDFDQLMAHALRGQFTRKTKRGLVGHFDLARRWAAQFRDAQRSLADLLWSAGEGEECMRWLLRPHADGRAKSEASAHPAVDFMRLLFLATGRPQREVRDRIEDLESNLRRDGSASGPLTALGLREEDPAPAPGKEQAAAIRATFARQIEHLRRIGRRGQARLIKVLRDRALFETCVWLGGRLGSVASFRADQIFIDHSEDYFFFENVVVKRTPRRRKPFFPERWVGEFTYSRWTLPSLVFEAYCELLEARGYDLRAYMKERRPELLPWIEVIRPDTFGPDAVGRKVSALWDGGRAGHLTASGIAHAMRRICRAHGIERGQVHIWRRFAAVQTNEAAGRDQSAVLKLLRMSEETRRRYVISMDSSVHKVYPEQASASEALARQPEALPAAAPETAAAPAPPVAAPAVGDPGPAPEPRPRSASRPRRALGYTLADIVRRA